MKCGVPTGGSCFAQTQCRTGACYQRVCGGTGSGYASYTSIVPSAILVAGGRLYYSLATQGSGGSAAAAILSCKVDECPSGATTVSAPPEGIARIVAGGDAQTMFFVELASFYGGGSSIYGFSGELFRCALPDCAAPVAMGLPSATRVELVGNDAYVLDYQSSSLMRCTRDSCAGATRDPLPDPEIGGGTGASLESRPFAVDATTTYWATPTIFGKAGNLVVATPR
jgi:hypothetical protein